MRRGRGNGRPQVKHQLQCTSDLKEGGISSPVDFSRGSGFPHTPFQTRSGHLSSRAQSHTLRPTLQALHPSVWSNFHDSSTAGPTGRRPAPPSWGKIRLRMSSTLVRLPEITLRTLDPFNHRNSQHNDVQQLYKCGPCAL